MTPSRRTRINYWRILVRSEVLKIAARGEIVRESLFQWALEL